MQTIEANAKPQKLIFVYGTLKQGGRLNHVLKGDNFVGEASLEGFELHEVPNGNFQFPAIVPKEGAITHGEAYLVEGTTIVSLDYIEGVPKLYHRKPVTIKLNGTEIGAQTYVWAGAWEVGPVVEGGSWKV